MAQPPAQRARSPIRLLAPIALVVTFIAFAVVILGARGDDDPSPAADSDTQTQADTSAKPKPKPKPQPTTYTVKTGDSLGSIAETTNIPVERLQELNPELDPQALVSGQKIKLKE